MWPDGNDQNQHAPPNAGEPFVTAVAPQLQSAVHPPQSWHRASLPTVHRVALGKQEWFLRQKHQAVVAGPDKHFAGRGKMLKEELWPRRGKENNTEQLCHHHPSTNGALDLFSISHLLRLLFTHSLSLHETWY